MTEDLEYIRIYMKQQLYVILTKFKKNFLKKGKAQKVQVPKQLKGLISKYGQEFFLPSSVRHLRIKLLFNN